MRGWACSTFSVIGMLVGLAVSAEAACTQSQIAVAIQAVVFGTGIPAAWTINPPCDVIETGLLFGTDPAGLELVGQPIYGLRSAYQQLVSVSESRVYWIAAYALDEEGRMIRSAPRQVLVAIPPIPFHGRHGSHGAPPSYTGTDADFLRQAGEPHFASFRRYSFNSDFLDLFKLRFTNLIIGSIDREVGSTHRDEALAGQDGPLTAGNIQININLSEVRSALDQLDQNFVVFGHPRPGLYLTGCVTFINSTNLDEPFGQTGCGPDAQAYR